MEKFNLVLNAFELAVEHCQKKYYARVEKIENAWSEANDGLQPNRDKLGRYHSPCDGYALAYNLDFLPDVDVEKLYRKGEYLPTPLCDDEDTNNTLFKRSSRAYETYRSKEKIKVEADLAELIVKEICENSFIEFSHGNSWAVNGTKICYLYMKAHVENAFKYFVESVKTVIENTDKHIYTGSAYEGREKVYGTIVSIIEEEQISYGGYCVTEMIKKFFIVLDNDSTCFGNAPSNGYYLEKSDRVEFTATFTKAKNSDHHAYYKRPHKMALIKNEVNEE